MIKETFDYESSRIRKPGGVGKPVVWALGLIIVALALTTATFVILYVQELNEQTHVNDEGSTTSTVPSTTSSTVTSPTSTVSSPTGAPESSTTNSTAPSPTSTVSSPTGTPESSTTSTVSSTTSPITTSSSTSTSVPECSEPGCIEAAARLRKSMNPDVNPCDDFYEFACGRWNQTESIPDDRGSWGVFDILRRELSTTLLSLLNVTHADGVPLNATQKMQKYFHSCLDEEALDDDSNLARLKEHLLDLFPEAADYMSTDRPWHPTPEELFRTVARARQYGLTMGLFSNYITSDFENPRQNIIGFGASSLGMERSLYLKENATERDAYVKYLTDMFFLFGEKYAPGNASLENDQLLAQQFLEFETVLAKARLTPEETRANTSIQYNKMTLSQFASTYTSRFGVNASYLIQYFSNAWNNSDVDAVLSENTIVNVADTRYWGALSEQLSNLTSDNATTADPSRSFFGKYLIWQIARVYVGRLGTDFRNISRTFNAVLSGVSTSSPRWESCVNSVTNEFPEAVGRLYVQDHFKKETKERLQTMVDYIFDAFRTIVFGSKWMTHRTRVKALEKAINFAVLIGYDDYIVDDSDKLNNEHNELTITASYLQNAISRNHWTTLSEGQQLLNGTTPTTWITGPAVVNAFYAPSLNSISFPAAILQPPFLGSDYPDYWNFGAVGTVIGHEITHGFDDRGSQFGSDGSFTNWWDAESRANFRTRADQLVYQYGNYTLMGQQLNGVLTQGENIADNGGMKEAFYGYKNFIELGENKTAQLRLPGLSYTPEQVFFLANAQVWCNDFKPQTLANQIRTGAHSPGRFRVIGPMQNFDEFSKAYSCPVGSYMNPEKKNSVW